MPDDPKLPGNAKRAASHMHAVVTLAAQHLAGICAVDGKLSVSRLDDLQPALYQLAFLGSEATALDGLLAAAEEGSVPPATAARAAGELVRSARHRIDGYGSQMGLGPDALDSRECRETVSAGLAEPDAVLGEAAALDSVGLSDDLGLVAQEFRRFGQQVIEPEAEAIHRRDLDIPDSIIDGLARMGAFGLSIPHEYGGSLDRDHPDHLGMVVATEELSRFSLGAGGSLITRPEILARALVNGGTEEQRRRWLPAIASGEKLVAVSTTEPDTGSDVAAIRTAAIRTGAGYTLRGTKTWATFAGRADILSVLARTDSDPASRHGGLSLFVVEKPRCLGREFELVQPGGGKMIGNAIATLGYRGMHSFEVAFDDWEIPADALVGGPDGEGRGFHLQVEAFAAGRLQTAARAIGLMRAAFDAAHDYAEGRNLFGRRLIDFPLTADRLASMAARIALMKLFSYRVAGHLTSAVGQLEASMVKALACRAAEEVTRDALQIFGGYGYAEEYPVSRYFVDARVLSIFEGAEEVLALRVIGRRLVEQATG